MAAEKKQITRTRTSYSCQICRRRKVRCDKQHPRCGGCIKAGETCVYHESDSVAASVRRSISRECTPARKRRATDHDETNNGDGQSPSPAFRSIGQKLDELTRLVHDINRLTPVSMRNSPDAAHQLEKSTAYRNSRIERTAPHTDVNHIGQSGDSSIHSTSWEEVLSRLEQLNVILKTDVRTRIPPTTHALDDSAATQQRGTSPGDPSSLDFLRLHARSSSPKLLDELNELRGGSWENNLVAPSEEESTVLFRSWMWSIYPVLPILSPKIVFESYTTFQRWYRHGLDKGEPIPDPSFVPYLALIWYTGYGSLSEKAKRKWFAWAVDDPVWMSALRTRLGRSLEIMKADTTSSIFTIAAAITCQYLAVHGQDIMKGHLYNIINLRAAQSLGIHNERTLKGMTSAEAETRRRLWWEAVSLDASLSTVSGTPVVIDERYTDTRIISELKDTCVGTEASREHDKQFEESGKSSHAHPDDPINWQSCSLVSVYHLVSKARHLLTVATKKVLKANMSAGLMNMEDLKEVRKSMIQVGNEVRDIINSIQTRGIPELDFVPETNPPLQVDHLHAMGEELTLEEIKYFLREESSIKTTNPVIRHHRATTIAFHKWARVMLSMLIDRLECISYAPFLKSSKSRLWAMARNCALRACHSYMRKFLSLAEDPELRQFRWTWLSTFHPMHATIIMLVDVHDRPHSDEAPRSRAMIDKMFSLLSTTKLREFPQYGPEQTMPLKEGGEEAWSMLRKLRHKAWQNAGLDPNVLWTEDDQMAVGVGKPLRENDLFIRSLREDIISKHKQLKDRENEKLFSGPSYEAATKQRMHPSDIGPGDPVTGSVIRGVADFDNISMIPRSLLLRARDDQALMPYPVLDRTRKTNPTQNIKQRNNPAKIDVDQSNSSDQVIQIGELIQRIRQTKRSDNKERTVLPSQAHQDLDSKPTPLENGTWESTNHGSKTSQSTLGATHKDVLDPYTSDPAIRSIDSNLQGLPTSTGDTATQPFLPNQTADASATRNESFTPRQPHQFTTSASNTSPLPTMNNQQLNNPNPPFPIRTHQTTNSETQEPQINNSNQSSTIPTASDSNTVTFTDALPFTSTGTTGSGNAMDINMYTNLNMDVAIDTDLDFDWNRWDELFGHYAGFTGMLGDIDFDMNGDHLYFGFNSDEVH